MNLLPRVPRPIFRDKQFPVCPQGMEVTHFVGLLTYAPLVGCNAKGCPSPSRNTPVTDFRLEELLRIYSGGTVRDFHPIILFSSPDRTPKLPQNGYPVVGDDYNTAYPACQLYIFRFL